MTTIIESRVFEEGLRGLKNDLKYNFIARGQS